MDGPHLGTRLMTGGYRCGFPWSRWDWYLRDRYEDDGAEAVRLALSDMSGEDLTRKAVLGRASALGLKITAETHRRLSLEHRPRGASGARMATGHGAKREDMAHMTRQRAWCGKCKDFVVLPGATHCPKGHAKGRRLFAVDV